MQEIECSTFITTYLGVAGVIRHWNGSAITHTHIYVLFHALLCTFCFYNAKTTANATNVAAYLQRAEDDGKKETSVALLVGRMN